MRIDLPNYNSREQSHFNESFLPSELFISTDGGRTKNKINKESDKRLDTVYLERISENGAVVVGYATESKSILDEKIKTDILPGYIHTCQGYSECYAFSYNTNSNTFTILEKNITIKHLTKDGQFILYSPTISNDKKETFIYDINKKTRIPLTIDNVNKYLSDHPEKNILLSSITEYPFFAGIKRRNVDIQKISDNGQVFIGQLNRDLSKKQLNDSHYPRIAFITTNDGPIKEISRSKFGSSKLIDISADGNYSVGWEEVWHDDYQVRLPSGIKTSSALFSQAIRYDLSQNRLINIGNLSNRQNESSYRNARATDISADGKYIVGWSETDNYNYDTIPNNANSKGVSAFTIFHRHGFVHWNNTMHDLGTLNGGKDSEAHIITDDGRIIYGLATDEHNNWRQVVWRSDQLSDEAFNAEKQRQDAAEAKRIADEAEKQRREEQENKKRLALEEKQRQEAEATEAKRIADEAEKQRKEEENKKRLALEEKQRQEAEAAEAKRIADEAEKQHQDKADKKIKDIIPVEDELEQRAKEKVKEKENTKPSIVISKPIDIENTHRSMQLMAENGYKLVDMQQGQLRYLADATCSVGTEKACISGFAHYQNINKANATQTGLSGAYRVDINQTPLVIGLAIDTDVYSSLPKGYQYQGYALPLIGFSLDLMPSLNAELTSNALHLSLKGAYLNRKVSIERQVLDATEAGKGNAKISGYHIELQGYYPYSIADDLLLTPFVGLTFNQISRSAYSETQNVQFAAHYDALKAHSLLTKMGLGMDYLLGSSFILNTKAGLLWNLSHHQGNFRSHIDYLGQQDIDYSENKKQLKQRPFAHIGLTYQVDKHSSIGTKANWEMTTYRHHDMQFGINYTYRF
ncbi:autotransporter domain-containing protein [Proteus alimentorum]|uniref:autotransporter domain-containing protein n=1 Tax=Proteus alimentorum TaxID=1973495 RepID=UPI001E3C75AB|nr:autotransporter domain-containing protein [Proteus alimentorum]